MGARFVCALLARASAAARPPVCGSEASAIVQPSSSAGHSPIPDGPTGAAPVVESGAVANPPVAVVTGAPPPSLPVATTASSAPTTATAPAAVAAATSRSS